MKASCYQERFWIDAQLYPDIPINNEVLTYELDGALDIPRLQRALSALLHKHSILRCYFVRINNSLELKLLSDIPLPFENHLINEEELEPLITRTINRIFDLSKGPLWLAALFQYKKNKFRLVLVFHHIISGGNTYILFRKELSQFYNQPWKIAELQPQIFYDECLQRCLTYERLEFEYSNFDGMEYYFQQLQGRRLSYDLPPGQPDETSFHFLLKGDLVKKLYAYCMQTGCSPFRLIASAFSLFLYLIFKQQGTLAYAVNTQPKKYPDMMGSFVNIQLLPIEINLEGGFNDILTQTINARRETGNLKCPFEVILNTLKEQGVITKWDKPNVIISETDLNIQELKLQDIDVRSLYRYKPETSYDIMLEYEIGVVEIQFIMTMKRAWFSSEVFTGEFVILFSSILTNAISNSHQPINQLNLLKPDEQEKLAEAMSTPPNTTDTQVTNPSQYQEKKILGESSENEGELVKKIIEIWSKLLPNREFELNDNFFDCGGNSILLAYLQWHIEKLFSIKLTMAGFFSHPTVAEMAKWVAKNRAKQD